MGKRGPQPRPEARKIAKGLRLSPAAWVRLEEIATKRGTTQAASLEEMIMQTYEQEVKNVFPEAQISTSGGRYIVAIPGQILGTGRTPTHAWEAAGESDAYHRNK